LEGEGTRERGGGRRRWGMTDDDWQVWLAKEEASVGTISTSTSGILQCNQSHLLVPKTNIVWSVLTANV
jgi:hypothetical protein